MPKVYPELKSAKVIKRYENNPVLSMKDVPYEATCIYNAGVTKFKNKYVMVFRDDVRRDGYGTCRFHVLIWGLPQVTTE